MRKDPSSRGIFSANPLSKTGDVISFPKAQYVTAVGKLAQLATGKVEVDYGKRGDVRFLTSDGSLFGQAYKGSSAAEAFTHARKFLALEDTNRALGLKHAELADAEVYKFPFGTRVILRQTATVKGADAPLPVWGGSIVMLIDNEGKITVVESTIRRGTKPARLGKVITAAQAVEKAKAQHGTPSELTSVSALQLSSHEVVGIKRKTRRLDPIYEVVLTSKEPYTVMAYLVDARSGKVVHSFSRFFHSQKSKSQAAVNDPQCRYFPSTPDPNKSLDSQLVDYVVQRLPDPTVLQNRRFEMNVLKRGNWGPLKSKADGTFNYGARDAELTGLIDFVAMDDLMEFQEACGMKPFDRPVPCFPDDPTVQDNAYFDPQGWDSHMGVGSGPPNGLRKRIGLDKMVPRHEVNGHGAITSQTPAHDLPGPRGAAGHEGKADGWALAGEYLDRIRFAAKTGIAFTLKDIQNDPRVIGPYTIDGGIRKQRNTKQAGRDETGEPHDDGEIIGAAVCDLLQALCEKYNPDLSKGIEVWGRITMAADSVMPTHNIAWKDYARAYIAGDQAVFAGAHRDLIEKAMGDHGIKVGNQGNAPVVVKVPSRRKRTPSKRRRRAA